MVAWGASHSWRIVSPMAGMPGRGFAIAWRVWALCGVDFNTNVCMLWCCLASHLCAACVWSVHGVADSSPGDAPICAQSSPWRLETLVSRPALHVCGRGAVHVAIPECVYGLCVALVSSPLAAGCVSQTHSACVMQAVLVAVTGMRCAWLGAVLRVAIVLACVCGLCAALLMAPQETHLSVLKSGSWMLEAWCHRLALRMSAGGVLQEWWLAVHVCMPCVVPLSVLLPLAGCWSRARRGGPRKERRLFSPGFWPCPIRCSALGACPECSFTWVPLSRVVPCLGRK